jgi:broad-specificity NMP kinase
MRIAVIGQGGVGKTITESLIKERGIKIVNEGSDMKNTGKLNSEVENKLKIIASDTRYLQPKSGKELRREKRKQNRKQNKQSKR